MEKRPTMKKPCKQRCFEQFWDARALKTLQKHAKIGILKRFYGEKRVNYRVFDGKHCKDTVNNNVLEGFLEVETLQNMMFWNGFLATNV